jgi:2-polyprenyl-3-methyl-5-hydroxy-6-metoxy-1,4-benzoquinol methylase
MRVNGFTSPLAAGYSLYRSRKELVAYFQRKADNDPDIYRHPAYPFFQHVSQSFLNEVTGRRRFVLEHLQNAVFDPPRVFEVGCGVGLIACELAKVRTDVEIFAMDISLSVVTYARGLVNQSFFAGDATFMVGDLLSVPMGPNEFSTVIALEVVEHTSDPVRSLAELRRITSKGGMLITSTPVRSLMPGHVTLFNSTSEVVAVHMAAGWVIEYVHEEELLPGIPDVMIIGRKVSS